MREEQRQSIEGLSLSQSDKGTLSWTLKSRHAVLREDEKLATLTEPTIEFYKDGKPVSKVTALTGTIETEAHNVHLSSSVAVNSYEDQSRLMTSDLLYDSARHRFTTTADVVVQRPEGILRGKGLEAKPDLSEIRIFNQSSTLNERPL